ncbi:MAG: ABC transporter permease, partial [Blastococcus sp.]|nr:ABC transporter permease [Blastococcus sp.]
MTTQPAPAAPTAGAAPGVPVSLRPATPRWRETLGLLARNPTAAVSALLLLALVLVAVFDETLAPEGPNEVDVAARLQSPSWAHPFGTDKFGRDLFSRV